MLELLEANWPLVIVAFVIGVAIAWYVFHASRRTQIETRDGDVLSQGAAPAERNRALIDSPSANAGASESDAPPPAAAAVFAPAGPAVLIPNQDVEVDRGQSQGDDLTRIKGLGPKIASQLAALGVTRIQQIAEWDEAAIDRVDAQLGRFQGRIRRDDWVGQAQLLLRGDASTFDERYGKIT